MAKHRHDRHRGSTCATINVVGGYLVTDRMLAMFRKKDRGGK